MEKEYRRPASSYTTTTKTRTTTCPPTLENFLLLACPSHRHGALIADGVVAEQSRGAARFILFGSP